MRLYQYLSKTKIDVLLSQIPSGFFNDLHVELGFNLGLLNGKLATADKSKISLATCAEAVESFLERNGEISNDFTEGSWARGEFNARSGILPECPGLVLFVGKAENTDLLLAGSESNLVSGSSSPGCDTGWSFMPRTLQKLREFSEERDTITWGTSGFQILRELGMDPRTNMLDDASTNDQIDEICSKITDCLPPPEVKMEYLAKIFFSSKCNQQRKAAIGTPLFVSS